jgi:ribose 5-phosphate isomerase A
LKDVVYVTCSAEVGARAALLGLPVVVLNERPGIDLNIDGADEVDRELRLLKGSGGSLLCEKTLAQASRRNAIVIDRGKLSDCVGQRAKLTVEVFPFAWRAEQLYLEDLGGNPRVRAVQGGDFVTECGHLVLDCDFGRIADPARLSACLDARAGIAGHGLFVNVATEVFVGKPDGVHLVVGKREPSAPP